MRKAAAKSKPFSGARSSQTLRHLFSVLRLDQCLGSLRRYSHGYRRDMPVPDGGLNPRKMGSWTGRDMDSVLDAANTVLALCQVLLAHDQLAASWVAMVKLCLVSR